MGGIEHSQRQLFSYINLEERIPVNHALLQVLFTIRSEQQLVEHVEYSLLYRWFVGLSIDDLAWDHSAFTHNRNRLLTT